MQFVTPVEIAGSQIPGSFLGCVKRMENLLLLFFRKIREWQWIRQTPFTADHGEVLLHFLHGRRKLRVDVFYDLFQCRVFHPSHKQILMRIQDHISILLFTHEVLPLQNVETVM